MAKTKNPTALEIINGPLQLGSPVSKDDVTYHELVDNDGNRSMLVYGDNAEIALKRAKIIQAAVNWDIQ